MPSLCCTRQAVEGYIMSGRDRADDDQVHFLQVEGMRLQQILHRFDGQIAGGHALVDHVTLANAGTLQDPLVGGVHHLFKVSDW